MRACVYLEQLKPFTSDGLVWIAMCNSAFCCTVLIIDAPRGNTTGADRLPKPTIAVVSAVAFWEKVITRENASIRSLHDTARS